MNSWVRTFACKILKNPYCEWHSAICNILIDIHNICCLLKYQDEIAGSPV